jgi:hypothetical protein
MEAVTSTGPNPTSFLLFVGVKRAPVIAGVAIYLIAIVKCKPHESGPVLPLGKDGSAK